MRASRTFMFIVLSLFILAPFQNCGVIGKLPAQMDGTSSSFSAAPKYSEIHSQVIVPKCLACHAVAPYNFSNYQTLMASGAIVAGNPTTSSFFQKVMSGEMPQSGSRLHAIEIEAIYDWILSGASDGSPLPTIPNAPTGLTAVGVTMTSVGLSWTLPSGTLTSVKVERATSVSGPFNNIANLNAASVNYVDNGLTAGTSYFYRVSVNNSVGSSPYSEVVEGMTLTSTPAVVPAAPSNLGATAVSVSQIDLSWLDNSTNETGFQIERGTNVAGPFTLVSTVAAGVVTYSNNGLTAATTYYFRVRTLNSAGFSSYTTVVSARTQDLSVTIPAMPTNLTVTANSSTQLTLTWVDNSDDETGFQIERATAQTGPFATIFTTGANVTSYVNTGLSASTTYYFRLRSLNSAGSSSTTSVMSGMTQAPPNPNATYTWVKANVINVSCASCHVAVTLGGYNFGTYAGVRSSLTPGESDNSKFFTEIDSGNMPMGGSKLSAATIANVKAWIDAGALEN